MCKIRATRSFGSAPNDWSPHITNFDNTISPAGARWLNQPATDIGPATTPRNWCPGAAPEWDRLTEEYGGGAVCTWIRTFPAEDKSADVWIRAEDRIVDGRVMRTAPRMIHYGESPDLGITSPEARRVAAELLNAADALDAAAHGL